MANWWDAPSDESAVAESAPTLLDTATLERQARQAQLAELLRPTPTSAEPSILSTLDSYRQAKAAAANPPPVIAAPAVPEDANRSRTWGEVGSDVLAGLARGATGITQGMANLADLATLGGVSALTKAGGSLADSLLGGRGEGYTLQEANREIGQAIEGMESAPLRQQRQQFARTLQETGTQGGVSGALDKFVTGAKETLTNPMLLGQFATEQVPMIATLGLGTIGTAAKAEAAAKAAGLTGQAVRDAGIRAAERANILASGVLGSGFSSQQAADAILNAPIEDLFKNEQYVELAKTLGDRGARAELARQAGYPAAAIAGPLSALAGRITAPLETRAFLGQLPKGITPALVAGGKEGLEEALQEPSEQFGSNVGERFAGMDKSLLEGLPEAAGQAGAAGFLMGLGLGGVNVLQNTRQEGQQARAAGESTAQRLDQLSLAGLSDTDLDAAIQQTQHVIATPKLPPELRDRLTAAMGRLNTDQQARANGDALRQAFSEYAAATAPEALADLPETEQLKKQQDALVRTLFAPRTRNTLVGMSAPDKLHQLNDAEMAQAGQVAVDAATLLARANQPELEPEIRSLLDAARTYSGELRQRRSAADVAGEVIGLDGADRARALLDSVTQINGNPKQFISPEYQRATLADDQLPRLLERGQTLLRLDADPAVPFNLAAPQRAALTTALGHLRAEQAHRQTEGWPQRNQTLSQVENPKVKEVEAALTRKDVSTWLNAKSRGPQWLPALQGAMDQADARIAYRQQIGATEADDYQRLVANRALLRQKIETLTAQAEQARKKAFDEDWRFAPGQASANEVTDDQGREWVRNKAGQWVPSGEQIIDSGIAPPPATAPTLTAPATRPALSAPTEPRRLAGPPPVPPDYVPSTAPPKSAVPENYNPLAPRSAPLGQLGAMALGAEDAQALTALRSIPEPQRTAAQNLRLFRLERMIAGVLGTPAAVAPQSQPLAPPVTGETPADLLARAANLGVVPPALTGAQGPLALPQPGVTPDAQQVPVTETLDGSRSPQPLVRQEGGRPPESGQGVQPSRPESEGQTDKITELAITDSALFPPQDQLPAKPLDTLRAVQQRLTTWLERFGDTGALVQVNGATERSIIPWRNTDLVNRYQQAVTAALDTAESTARSASTPRILAPAPELSPAQQRHQAMLDQRTAELVELKAGIQARRRAISELAQARLAAGEAKAAIQQELKPTFKQGLTYLQWLTDYGWTATDGRGSVNQEVIGAQLTPIPDDLRAYAAPVSADNPLIPSSTPPENRDAQERQAEAEALLKQEAPPASTGAVNDIPTSSAKKNPYIGVVNEGNWQKLLEEAKNSKNSTALGKLGAAILKSGDKVKPEIGLRGTWHQEASKAVIDASKKSIQKAATAAEALLNQETPTPESPNEPDNANREPSTEAGSAPGVRPGQGAGRRLALSAPRSPRRTVEALADAGRIVTIDEDAGLIEAVEEQVDPEDPSLIFTRLSVNRDRAQQLLVERDAALGLRFPGLEPGRLAEDLQIVPTYREAADPQRAADTETDDTADGNWRVSLAGEPERAHSVLIRAVRVDDIESQDQTLYAPAGPVYLGRGKNERDLESLVLYRVGEDATLYDFLDAIEQANARLVVRASAERNQATLDRYFTTADTRAPVWVAKDADGVVVDWSISQEGLQRRQSDTGATLERMTKQDWQSRQQATPIFEDIAQALERFGWEDNTLERAQQRVTGLTAELALWQKSSAEIPAYMPGGRYHVGVQKGLVELEKRLAEAEDTLAEITLQTPLVAPSGYQFKVEKKEGGRWYKFFSRASNAHSWQSMGMSISTQTPKKALGYLQGIIQLHHQVAVVVPAPTAEPAPAEPVQVDKTLDAAALSKLIRNAGMQPTSVAKEAYADDGRLVVIRYDAQLAPETVSAHIQRIHTLVQEIAPRFDANAIVLRRNQSLVFIVAGHRGISPKSDLTVGIKRPEYFAQQPAATPPAEPVVTTPLTKQDWLNVRDKALKADKLKLSSLSWDQVRHIPVIEMGRVDGVPTEYWRDVEITPEERNALGVTVLHTLVRGKDALGNPSDEAALRSAGREAVHILKRRSPPIADIVQQVGQRDGRLDEVFVEGRWYGFREILAAAQAAGFEESREGVAQWLDSFRPQPVKVTTQSELREVLLTGKGKEVSDKAELPNGTVLQLRLTDYGWTVIVSPGSSVTITRGGVGNNQWSLTEAVQKGLEEANLPETVPAPLTEAQQQQITEVEESLFDQLLSQAPMREMLANDTNQLWLQVDRTRKEIGALLAQWTAKQFDENPNAAIGPIVNRFNEDWQNGDYAERMTRQLIATAKTMRQTATAETRPPRKFTVDDIGKTIQAKAGSGWPEGYTGILVSSPTWVDGQWLVKANLGGGTKTVDVNEFDLVPIAKPTAASPAPTTVETPIGPAQARPAGPGVTAIELPVGAAALAPAPAPARPADYGKSNTIFTEDAAAKARELLKRKLGQLNAGLDPEIIQAGITLAGYHIEAGARAFADYAQAMINDLGEAARPFLRSWYEGARHYPGFDKTGLTRSSSLDASEELDVWPGDVWRVDIGSRTVQEVTDENIFWTDGRRTTVPEWRSYGQEGADIEVQRLSRVGAMPQEAAPVAETPAATPDLEETPEAPTPKFAAGGRRLAESIKTFLLDESGPLSANQLWSIADTAFGGTQAEGRYNSKDAYDAMELGLNQAVLDSTDAPLRGTTPEQMQEALAYLERLQQRLPTQTRRDAEQQQMQQFSTPHVHSHVVAWVAHIQPTDVVLEPTAGTGNLVTHAKLANPAAIFANELSERRDALLRQIPGVQVFNENANHLHAILPARIQPTVVVMNPPFSADVNLPGQKKLDVGALHIEQALQRLQPGGRLVAIVGRGMAMDAPRFSDWWKKIEKQYNVRANIAISGREYTKFGTSFDNRILVIDKNGQTGIRSKIIGGEVERVADLIPLLKGVRDERTLPTQSTPVVATGQTGVAGPERETGTGPAVSPATGGVRGRPARPVPNAQGRPGRPEGGAGAADERAPGESVAAADNQPGQRGRATTPGTGPESAGPGIVVGGDLENQTASTSYSTQPLAPLEFEAREQGAVPPLDSQSIGVSRFESYQPQTLIKGAQPHPTPLVESAAMASVSFPPLTYLPTLPSALVTSGRLSAAQLETISYAGQAHAQLLPNSERRGFYIGDGTGVGKGAQVAGILLDNWNQGRKKAVWVSENVRLLDDARRDAEWVGLGQDRVVKHNDLKGTITLPEGVIFTTYDTLSSGEKETKGQPGLQRIDQLVNWLGADFEGVIAFDEAHNMANLKPQQGPMGQAFGSKRARFGVELQRRLPKARIVYVSATGATEIANLAYAERLGLWGEGTAFSDRDTFLSAIENGGLAAMEVVAKDLKAMGLYTARSLSYDGVDVEMLNHPLTPEQVTMYDTLATTWQGVLSNVEHAMVAANSKQNADARKRALSAFWGAHQRFFNSVLTSLSVPSLLKDVEAELQAHHSIVMQLVNTNEATQERRMAQAAEAGQELEDIDLSPRDVLMQYVQNSFPTTLYEEYLDDEGNRQTRPVFDSAGNAVQDPLAVAMRDDLLIRLATLSVPEGVLEQVINHFGSDAVAEITMRKRRLVRQKDGSVVEEKLSAAKRKLDAQAFDDGKKRILIFSYAGGTGRSYHADLRYLNQQRRVHYLVQPGWRADKAIQGLGRTHRTNQAQPPLVKPITTELKAQRRFISSIARRMDQMGAITRGQRDANTQGLFDEDANLENQYSQAALFNLFLDIAHGQESTITIAEVEKQMGITLLDRDGNLVLKKIPTIQQFLNRLLSLEIPMMDRVFDAFDRRRRNLIEYAKQTGTYDTGMETLVADSLIKLDDQLAVDHAFGTPTRYLKLEATHPNRIITFKELQSNGAPLLYARNRKSGRLYAFLEAGVTRTDTNTGAQIPQVIRQSPIDRRYFDRREITGENYEEIKFATPAEARAAWEQAMAEAPQFYKETLHLLTGALLPIWDRLPQDTTRVIRAQTDTGERLLGRVLPNKDVNETLRRLGVGVTAPKLTGQQALDALLNEGATLVLANNWRVTSRTVNGQSRIEVLPTVGTKTLSDADRNLLESMGGFSEMIAWNYRIFLPTDQPAVLERLIASKPIIEVLEPGQTPSAPARPAAPAAATPAPATPPQRFAIAATPASVRASLGAIAGDRIVQDLIDAGSLVLVATQQDAVRRSQGRIQIPPGQRVGGAVDPETGTVYLIAEHIRPADVAGLLRHEVAVHQRRLGLDQPKPRALRLAMALLRLTPARQWMGETTFAGVLDQMEQMRKAGNVRVVAAFEHALKAMKALNQDINNSRLVAEEALAYLVGDKANADLSVFRRILAALRTFLTRAGFKLELTTDDLVMLAQSALETAAQREVRAGAITKGVLGRNEEDAEAARQYAEVVARYTNPDGSKKAGWLKAPNGQPTKLSERQWVQTRTPNFIAWFGDFINDPENASKVVDENGEPLVVWHGTGEDFASFDRSYLGDNTLFNASDEWLGETSRIGFWFNTQPMTGAKYSPYSVDMPVFLNLRSVYRESETLFDLAGELKNRQLNGEEFKDWIESEGHDSVALEDTEFGGQSFVAFSPTQIKSAIGNTGAFSSANADIRYATALGLAEPTLTADELLAKVQAGDLAELTPEQWAQVQQAFLGEAATVATGVNAPTFKTWFGQSKIKSKTGQPVVMYHGTPEAFTVFDAARSGANTTHPTAALGFFFTNDQGHAAAKYGANVMAVYLAIEKPYAMTDADLRRIESLDDAKAFRARLEAQGYDGIVMPAETGTRYVAAFRPDQIKFTNNETYTRGQADMRFAVDPDYARLQALWNEGGEKITKDKGAGGRDTSIMQLPAGADWLLSSGIVQPGSTHLDLGAGKFDKMQLTYGAAGVTTIPLDPYNRSEQRNRAAYTHLQQQGGVDSASSYNVLNVVHNLNDALNVVRFGYGALKPGGTFAISVYDGNRKGIWDGSQHNRPLKWYEPFVQAAAPDATIDYHNGLMLVKKPATGEVEFAPYVHGFTPIGKNVSGSTYVHRDYIDQSVMTDAQKALAKAALEQDQSGIPFNLVAVKNDASQVILQESPDFDTAAEPHLNRSVTYAYRNDVLTPIRTEKGSYANPKILHGKHAWVGDDYTGFGPNGYVEAEKRYSAWKTADVVNRSGYKLATIGRRNAWDDAIRREPIPELRFAIAPGTPPQMTPPPMTRIEVLRRAIQDRFLRFKTVQNWLKQLGINLTPDADVYGEEERSVKRFAAQAQDFRDKTLTPLVQAAGQAGYAVTGGDFIAALMDGQPLPARFKPSIPEYLIAQHAAERNRAIAKINPRYANPDQPGSGLTDAEAATILARYQALPHFAAFKTMAEQFRAIAEGTKKLLLDAGILNAETVAAWDKAYQHYVPLKGGPEDAPAKQGTGPGNSVVARQRRAMGHDLRAENVLENIFRDRERALFNIEKNKVGQALIKLVQQANNPAIGTVGQPEKHATLIQGWLHEVWIEGRPLGAYQSYNDAKAAIAADSAATGRPVAQYGVRHKAVDPSVVYMTRPLLAENEAGVYINGELVRIQLNDEAAARAYNALGVDGAGGLLKVARSFNTFLSKAYTGYNPEFLLVNMARDLTAGTINLTGKYGAGFAAQALKHYVGSFREAWRFARDKGTHTWLDRYRQAGGSTGASYLSDLERLGGDIERTFEDAQGAVATWKAGKPGAAARVLSADVVRKVFGLIEAFNQAGENALRIATFRTVIEQGGSDAEAASAAANVTVNFNRRGEMTYPLGALYLFFNPNVQGTQVLLDTLLNSPHKRQAQAAAAGMVALAFLLANLARGGDDKDEERWRRIPGYLKDRNLILQLGEKQVTVPLPYGYGMFWALGNVLSDLAHGADDGKAGVRLASALFEHFSPLGNPLLGETADIKNLAELMPTLLRMPTDIMINRGGLGSPIMPEVMPWNPGQPDSARRWRETTGKLADKVTTGLNQLTGGSPYESGYLDVSPETIKYLWRGLTGGAGQFVSDTFGLGMTLAQGATPELRETPGLRKFVRVETIQNARTVFSDQAQQIREAVGAFNAAKRAQDAAGMADLVQDKAALIRLGSVLNQFQELIKTRRQLHTLIQAADLPLPQKRLQLKTIEQEEARLYGLFSQIFRKTVH